MVCLAFHYIVILCCVKTLANVMFDRLVGVNAAQLAIALVSNLFLLLNMARRVRFSIAQPITIVGW